MLCHLPRRLPALSTMLADIGQPHPSDLARALGVSPRTVARWIAADKAPRPAALALYWLTRWGAGDVEAGAVRRLQLAESLVVALRLELVSARRQAAYLERLAAPGSANAPRFVA